MLYCLAEDSCIIYDYAFLIVFHRRRFSPSFPHSPLKHFFLRQLCSQGGFELVILLFQLPSGDMWNAFDYRSWSGKEVLEDMTFEMVFEIQELLLMWFVMLEMEPTLGIILPLKCPPALEVRRGTRHEWAGRLTWLDDWCRTGCRRWSSCLCHPGAGITAVYHHISL